MCYCSDALKACPPVISLIGKQNGKHPIGHNSLIAALAKNTEVGEPTSATTMFQYSNKTLPRATALDNKSPNDIQLTAMTFHVEYAQCMLLFCDKGVP